MLEIKAKLKIRRSAYKLEIRGRLKLPFDSRQKSRLHAKLESGEFELHLQPVAIPTLVEAALGHLRKVLGERRIIVNASENPAPAATP